MNKQGLILLFSKPGNNEREKKGDKLTNMLIVIRVPAQDVARLSLLRRRRCRPGALRLTM